MRITFLAIIALLIAGCASTSTSVRSPRYDFAKFAKTGQVPLDSLLLTLSELPPGYSFGKKPQFMDIQTNLLYESPDLYSSIIGGESVFGKAFQTLEGPNDKGSVLFIFYSGILHPDAKDFFSGLLWGEDKPSADHPEEFFVNSQIMVVWSFPMHSQAKAMSQKKIFEYLTRTSKQPQ